MNHLDGLTFNGTFKNAKAILWYIHAFKQSIFGQDKGNRRFGELVGMERGSLVMAGAGDAGVRQPPPSTGPVKANRGVLEVAVRPPKAIKIAISSKRQHEIRQSRK